MNCRQTRAARASMGVSLCALLLIAACADRPTDESPEVRFEREAAHRQSCIAGLLAQRANEDLQVIQSALPTDSPTDPVSQLSQRAAMAAFEFARAYQRHAELRAGAYALLDSAVNHAETSADSTRYIERAGTFIINLPAEGTVEANVLERYQTEHSAMLAEQDHPCNWDFPF